MRQNTHAAISITLFTIIAAIGGFFTQGLVVLIGVLSSIFFSVLPDMLEFKILPHRGPTHSIVSFIILSVTAFYLLDVNLLNISEKLMVFIGFLCGYITHIFSDMFTDNGVCLFWPFHKKRIQPYRLWRYKAGEGYENALRYLLYLVIAISWAIIIFSIDSQDYTLRFMFDGFIYLAVIVLKDLFSFPMILFTGFLIILTVYCIYQKAKESKKYFQ